MAFNVVDWVILALVIVGGLAAGFSGFFDEISRKLGLVLGVVCGLMFASQLAVIIQNGTQISRFWSIFIAYIGIFLTAYCLTAFVGNVLERLFETLCLGFVDRILGFFLGLIEAVIVISIIWMLLASQTFFTLPVAFNESWMVNNIVSKVVILGKGIFGA